MKTISRLFAALAVVLCLASCEEPSGPVTPDPGPAAHERDIFYSVSDQSGIPSFSGTTAHLVTEAEWDALLDRFCDMASSGGKVTFCNQASADGPATKDGASSTPNTISTQNRDELKAWMKEMERAGKTVNVSYDNNSGTWNGTAYATFQSQEDGAEPQTYTGTLAFVHVPAVEEQPMPGIVWTLEVDGNIFVLTVHGMMIWSESIIPEMTLLDGMELTVEGVAFAHTDINGGTFMSLEISGSENVIIVK